jgi:hypothetical protein
LSASTAPRRIDRTTSQPRLTMTLRWYSTVIDATDPHRLAAFWADALGWETAYANQDEVALEAPNDPDDRIPALLFVRNHHPNPTRTDCISISTQTIKKTRCSGSSTSALAAPTSARAT